MKKLLRYIIENKFSKHLLGASESYCQEIANQLPDLYPQLWGFEIDLLSEEKSCDLLFEIKPGTCSWVNYPFLSQFGNPGSRLVRLFDERSSFLDEIFNIWFEFDFREINSQASVSSNEFIPSIFIGPSRDPFCYSSSIHALKLLELITNCKSPDVLYEILSCQHSSELEPFQVGYMYARRKPSYRIVSKNVTPKTSLFDNFSFSQYALLSSLMDYFSAFEIALGIDINVDGSINDLIGLEIYPKWANRTSIGSLFELISGIPSLSLNFEKVQSIEASLRRINFFSDYNSGIPSFSPNADSSFYSQFTDISLHHIKLAIKNDKIKGCKAYLGILSPQLNGHNYSSGTVSEGW